MSSSSPHLKLQVDQVKHRQHEHELGADDLDNCAGRQRARRLLLGQVHLLDCAATLLCSTKVKRKCLSRLSVGSTPAPKLTSPGRCSGPRTYRVGLGLQFFLKMTCLGVIYHIQKDSRSLDAPNPPKKLLKLFFVKETFDLVCNGSPL